MHVHTASCFGKDPVATRSATAVLPEEATAVFHSVKVSRRGKPNLFIKGTEALSGRNRGSVRAKQRLCPSKTEALSEQNGASIRSKQRLYSVKKEASTELKEIPQSKTETIFNKIHRMYSVKKEAPTKLKEPPQKQSKNHFQ
ncbi:hypothetical protein [Bacteroides pyogenes]|uniref:hypothetical protein n=1 Tax=Bacteroides pyogenes TaxID=310300 RepID=UPI0024309344|nr:hypothetical protein [Bacteroides pyogenes]